MSHTPPKNIVILGGGIVGVSTAYFLSTHAELPADTHITIVEGSSVAAAASGLSGGFLAKDWHGAATISLSTMSFDLHKKLADDFGGKEKWGYRAVDTLSVETDATTKSKKSPPVPWLPHHVVSSRTLGTVTSTAQVHPGQFTRFFSERFLSQPNTSLLFGTATALASSNGSVESVLVSPKDGGAETVVPADAVVIAAGPWTGKLAIDLLGKDIGGKLGVEGHRAHSIVLRTKEQLTPHCLFTSMTMEDGSMAEPECYTRPDGTTYICGAGDNEPLPATAAEVSPSPSAIAKLYKQAASLSPVFDPSNGATTEAEQACYLPIPDRGRPLIGKVRGLDGVYVGSGLSCWGITQGPGTGLCLAELLVDGKVTSADITKLAP